MKFFLIFLFQLSFFNFAYSIDKQFDNIAGVKINRLYSLSNQQLNSLRCEAIRYKDNEEYEFIFYENFASEIDLNKYTRCKNKFEKNKLISKKNIITSISVVKTKDIHTLGVGFIDEYSASKLVNMFFKDFKNIYSYTFNGNKYFYIKNKTYDVVIGDGSISIDKYTGIDDINFLIEDYFK